MNKKWDELEAGLDAIYNIESIEAQLTEANAEITTLRESLAWYGDEGNWTGVSRRVRANTGGTGLVRISPVEEDKGQRARDALQKGE